jgi:hypothetical protein
MSKWVDNIVDVLVYGTLLIVIINILKIYGFVLHVLNKDKDE